jgi:hypothetical protein
MRVILFDLSQDVVDIWEYLMGVSCDDFMSLPVQPVIEGRDIRQLGLTRVQSLLIQRWLTPNGSNTNWWIPPSMRVENENAIWSEHTKKRIAGQLPLLKNWSSSRGDFAECPDIEAHWHIDPPYQFNAAASAKYRTAPVDYERLSGFCRSRRGDVTVHEGPGATWLPFERLPGKHMTARRHAGKAKTCQERVWTNDPRALAQKELFA